MAAPIFQHLIEQELRKRLDSQSNKSSFSDFTVDEVENPYGFTCPPVYEFKFKADDNQILVVKVRESVAYADFSFKLPGYDYHTQNTFRFKDADGSFRLKEVEEAVAWLVEKAF